MGKPLDLLLSQEASLREDIKSLEEALVRKKQELQACIASFPTSTWWWIGKGVDFTGPRLYLNVCYNMRYNGKGYWEWEEYSGNHGRDSNRGLIHMSELFDCKEEALKVRNEISQEWIEKLTRNQS